MIPLVDLAWEPGRLDDVLMVKVADPAVWHAPWGSTLAGARIRHRGVSGWYRVDGVDVETAGTALAADRRVLSVYRGYAPMPPPSDIPPTTPDFVPEQVWLEPVTGLGFTEAARWPGGDGRHVRIADVEYSWDPTHEDLGEGPVEVAWGFATADYQYHGNSVLGQLIGGDNAYGVTGAVPAATALMISPFLDAETYDVAAAIAGATALLGPGDVLLIEQQSYARGDYAPVEVEPAVWDAIRAATDAGIVVVEPAGNGAQDLDSAVWNGWFDRSHDSGAILVGGGASSLSEYEPRAWYPFGSCYGARIDVQGWFDHIVTATTGEYDGWFADLYFPERDTRQAYTESFGGTSGASPMVTAAVAILQSVAIETTGSPWGPEDIRALLRSTGTPQTGEIPIGPEPHLRRLLRMVAGP